MTRALWITALAALVTLAACGAGEPPEAPGGIDLSPVWDGSY